MEQGVALGREKGEFPKLYEGRENFEGERNYEYSVWEMRNCIFHEEKEKLPNLKRRR